MASKTGVTEDKVALGIGILIFLASTLKLAGVDLLGWAVTAKLWTDPMNALAATTPAYAGVLPGWAALVVTYVIITAVLALGIKMLGGNVGKFVKAFTVIYVIALLCYAMGANAHIAATPNQREGLKIAWSLGLTTEAGFIVALVVGLIISNFMPSFAESLKEACRPELFVKIAIVVLGAELGVKASDAAGFAGHIIFRGLCAIVEAYLLYWAFAYYVARKYFHFSREWAVPMASGISICGVSAAIASGSAIRARPVVPVMVSSLVVVFTCIEMLVLPFIASYFLTSEPMVAGGWMGLAVKSDGGAIAAGAITESLILGKAAAQGIVYEAGWITMVTTTVKVFIDIFIGVWAFVLAWIWCAKFDKTRGERTMTWSDVWDRFPRFVLGYALLFVLMLVLCLQSKDLLTQAKGMIGSLGSLRTVFFVLTFFSIGMISNFRKLWEEGIGRIALVYIVCLFGFIIWVGLFISYLFFHGMTPPIIAG